MVTKVMSTRLVTKVLVTRLVTKVMVTRLVSVTSRQSITKWEDAAAAFGTPPFFEAWQLFKLCQNTFFTKFIFSAGGMGGAGGGEWGAGGWRWRSAMG